MTSILGVDVSTKKVAFAFVNGNDSSLSWLEIGASDSDWQKRFLELMRAVRSAVCTEPRFLGIQLAVLEDISFVAPGYVGSNIGLPKMLGAVQTILDTHEICTKTVHHKILRAPLGLNGKDKLAIQTFVNEHFKTEVPSHDVADAAVAALYGLSLISEPF